LFEIVRKDLETQEDEQEDGSKEEPLLNADIMVDSIKNVPPYIDLLILLSIILILWFILVVFN
jgi:hypothetical protein